MDYTIYTYGGGDILWEVLNVLAIIFKSDSKYFTAVAKFSMTIGALWAAVRASASANIGIFAKDWFIPSFLVFSLLFVPKASVNIVDHIDSNFKYAKVDHIPLGIAIVASTSSQISDALAEMIDGYMAPNDAMKFRTVGPMFGARLASAARDIQIKDPIMRANIKEFVSRCFMWPFVFTNLPPGKEAALQSKDILQFIQSSPHPSLGMYWRNSDGTSEFLHCNACSKKVDEVMKLEVPKGINELAQTVFGSIKDVGSDRVNLSSHNELSLSPSSRKLLTHFDYAWNYIANATSKAADVVEQEMMINAYREGLDDRREEFSLERVNPQLIAYSAARAGAQQNTSFLTKMLLAGKYIPSAQSVFICLILMFFIIVVAVTFLPGGFKVLIMWVQLNFWVHSWPVFYAIMNGIGHIFLTKAGLTQAYSNGQGLSIATQNGLSDAAYDAYCWVMGLQLSVPFISWAFISKSGYAITQMATSITQGLEGFASKIGSETADGNISFDTQSFHNRTMGSYQMAQQQLGANHNFARVVNDGSLAKTYGDNGALSAQAHMSNMATNIASNFNAAATASKSYQESAQLAYQNVKAFAERVASGKADLHNFSEQEANDIRTASEQFLRADSTLSKNHSISEQTRFDMMARGHASVKFDGGLAGKAVQGVSGFSGEIGATASAGMSADAANQEQINKARSSSEGQQFSQSGSELLQVSKQYSNQFSDNRSKELASNINRSQQEAKNWSKVASYAETQGISATTNETDNVLQYVADKQYGGNKDAAVHWANNNREAFQSIAGEYAAHQSESLKNMVKQADHVLSEQEIAGWMDRKHLPEVNSFTNELNERDLKIRQEPTNSFANPPLETAKEEKSSKVDSEKHEEKLEDQEIKTAENQIAYSEKKHAQNNDLFALENSSIGGGDDNLSNSLNAFNNNTDSIILQKERSTFPMSQQVDNQQSSSQINSEKSLKDSEQTAVLQKQGSQTTSSLSNNNEQFISDDQPRTNIESHQSSQVFATNDHTMSGIHGSLSYQNELPSYQNDLQRDDQKDAYQIKNEELLINSKQLDDLKKQGKQQNSSLKANHDQTLSYHQSRAETKSHQTKDIIPTKENIASSISKEAYQTNSHTQQAHQNDSRVEIAAEDEQLFGNIQHRVNARLANNERQLAKIQENLNKQKQGLESQHEKKDKKSNMRNALSKTRKDIKRTFS